MADGRVVGIDLGTTNSLVAYMEGDAPVVIPGVDALIWCLRWWRWIPFQPQAVAPQLLWAQRAQGAHRDAERVIYSVKRLMGRGLEEIQSELKMFPFHLAET